MVAEAPPPLPTTAPEPSMDIPTNHPLFTRIRLATRPLLHYQTLLLHHTFLQSQSFEFFTVFLIEVSNKPFSSSFIAHHPKLTSINKTLHFDYPIFDPELEHFKSSTMEEEVIVAGSVMFLPNYSVFMAKP